MVLIMDKYDKAGHAWDKYLFTGFLHELYRKSSFKSLIDKH